MCYLLLQTRAQKRVKKPGFTSYPYREVQGIVHSKIYLLTSKPGGNLQNHFIFATLTFFCVCAQVQVPSLPASLLVGRYEFERGRYFNLPGLSYTKPRSFTPSSRHTCQIPLGSSVEYKMPKILCRSYMTEKWAILFSYVYLVFYTFSNKTPHVPFEAKCLAEFTFV